MDKLLNYLKTLSPTQKIDFCERVGTTIGFLRKACYVGQTLSTETCVAIERESQGEVTRLDLCGHDLAMRRWPELFH